jgi:hypothetical protein
MVILKHCYGFCDAELFPLVKKRKSREEKTAGDNVGMYLLEEMPLLIASYITADKYDLPLLRVRIVNRFEGMFPKAIVPLFRKQRLEEVIHSVYDATVASKDLWRASIVRCMRAKCITLHRADVALFTAFLENVPEISPALILSLASILKSNNDLEREREIRGIADEWTWEMADNMDYDHFETLPLHYAAYHDNVETLREYVRDGEAFQLVDAFDEHGETPLHWAAQEGHLSVVKFLVTWGAKVGLDLNAASDDYGMTALHRAQQHNSTNRATEERAQHEKVISYLETQAITGGQGDKCCEILTWTRLMEQEEDWEPPICRGFKCCESCGNYKLVASIKPSG